MPELVLQLTRAGFLALLWIFVLFSLRVVRSDLYSAAGLRAPPGAARAPPWPEWGTAEHSPIAEGLLSSGFAMPRHLGQPVAERTFRAAATSEAKPWRTHRMRTGHVDHLLP